MALFSLSPKDTPRTLFGRDEELVRLVRLVHEGRWTVILGPRMVGKTSLMKAARRRFDRPGIYVNLWGARGTVGLLNAFLEGLTSSRPLFSRIRQGLRRIEGVSVGPAAVKIAAPARPLRTFWELLNTIGHEAGRSVVLLDEVQEIAPISGPLLKALGNLFNTHPDIVFVFTGSYFGILRTLLEPPADSPLSGRSPATLRLEPFPPEKSLAFLQRGLGEYGLRVPPDQLRTALDRSLDGIPGWLTLFGNNLSVLGMDLARAEQAAVAEGKRVVQSELAHFLEGRNARAHWDALRTLVAGASWVELRHALSARHGAPVNDHTVGNILRALRDANFVTELERRYSINDPMVRAYVRTTSSPPRARPS